MIKREHEKKRRQQDRELARATRTDASRISDIERALHALPVLPQNAAVRAVALAERLPKGLQVRVLKIVATKLASDFALRFLLLLDDVLLSGKTRSDELDLDDPKVRQVVSGLLDTWIQLPASIRVQTLQGFGSFARITAGLQVLLESALPEGQSTWVFDAGAQYRSMLFRTHLLPNATLDVHALPGERASEHAYEVQIARFDDIEARSTPPRGYWHQPSIAQETAHPVQARLITGADTASGSDIALAGV